MKERLTKAMLEERLADTLKAYGELEARHATEIAASRDLVASKDRQISLLTATIEKKDGAIAGYKDDLHARGLLIARLEGIIERVRELDPLHDREVHRSEVRSAARQLRDTAHSIEFPQSRLNGAETFSGGSQGGAMAHATSSLPPYYRRRD